MYMYLTLLNITDEFHGLPALLNFKPTGMPRNSIIIFVVFVAMLNWNIRNNNSMVGGGGLTQGMVNF